MPPRPEPVYEEPVAHVEVASPPKSLKNTHRSQASAHKDDVHHEEEEHKIESSVPVIEEHQVEAVPEPVEETP